MAKTASSTRKSAAKSAPKKSSAKQTEPALLELFTDEIKDIYWAEKKLVTALPKMQKASTSQELKNAIGEHIEVTRGHVTRLEQVFELLEEKPQAKKCDAMEGILKEGEGVIEDTEDGTATRDVGIILASQKVEHYEIATYGGLTQLATTLGRDDIAEILGQTLIEEKEADETLTGIAENNINYEAAEEDDAEEVEA
jgi:ferritin-like metal-binding protein YciE